MQKNKLMIIVLAISIFGSKIWAQNPVNNAPENIEVVHLYTPHEDEKTIHKVLFPLVTPYLKQVVSVYNKTVTNPDNQVNKVFISELFRSRIEQRKNHFEYITQGKGLISFLQLYDSYNDQFVVQFLHIVMPVFATPQATKRLLGTLNKALDRSLKNPFKLIQEKYVSEFLLKRLNITQIENFTSSNDSIQEIAKDASTYYDLDKEFITSVKTALKEKIQKDYHLSSEEVENSAQINFSFLLASEIFRLIQPEIKQQGDTLFSHPIIGKELTKWFKTAPAFSKHSIIGASDADLENLLSAINMGKNFQFAIDLGMKTNKDQKGNSVWDPENPENQLPVLKKALLSVPQFKSENIYLTLVPDKILMSSSEQAVHIELIVSKIPLTSSELSTPKDKTSIDFSAPTQEPSPSSEVTDESSIEKNFEIPNKDSSTEGKSRTLNLKTYSQILGDTYEGEDKEFENKNIPPLVNKIEPTEKETFNPQTKEESNKDTVDEDLDEKIDQHL